MGLDDQQGKLKPAFQNAAHPKPVPRSNASTSPTSAPNRFTDLQPGMHGPKPPDWIANEVNRNLHLDAQKRLARKVDLQNQFKKAASGQTQTRETTQSRSR